MLQICQMQIWYLMFFLPYESKVFKADVLEIKAKACARRGGKNLIVMKSKYFVQLALFLYSIILKIFLTAWSVYQ